jgi:hypothetical protein
VAFSRQDEALLERLRTELPSGGARDAYWREIGVTATEPVAGLTGRERDAMLAGMICRSGETLERAWGWVEEIEDPQRRMEAFDDMMFSLRPMDSDEYRPDARKRHEAFRQWLTNSEVPDDWKRLWLPFLNAESMQKTQ